MQKHNFLKVSTTHIALKSCECLFLKISIGSIFNILNWNAFQSTIILTPPFPHCIYITVHKPWISEDNQSPQEHIIVRTQKIRFTDSHSNVLSMTVTICTVFFLFKKKRKTNINQLSVKDFFFNL